MRYISVRLTRKLADRINGFDLSGHQVGDVLQVPSYVALMLMGEGWAFPVDPSAVASPDRSREGPTSDTGASILASKPPVKRQGVRLKPGTTDLRIDRGSG